MVHCVHAVSMHTWFDHKLLAVVYCMVLFCWLLMWSFYTVHRVMLILLVLSCILCSVYNVF